MRQGRRRPGKASGHRPSYRDPHQAYPYNKLSGLSGFLSSLILQKIFSIPTDSLLILFLALCKELRDFCGVFNKYLNEYNIKENPDKFTIKIL